MPRDKDYVTQDQLADLFGDNKDDDQDKPAYNLQELLNAGKQSQQERKQVETQEKKQAEDETQQKLTPTSSSLGSISKQEGDDLTKTITDKLDLIDNSIRVVTNDFAAMCLDYKGSLYDYIVEKPVVKYFSELKQKNLAGKILKYLVTLRSKNNLLYKLNLNAVITGILIETLQGKKEFSGVVHEALLYNPKTSKKSKTLTQAHQALKNGDYKNNIAQLYHLVGSRGLIE